MRRLFLYLLLVVPCLATADEDKKVSKLGDEAHRISCHDGEAHLEPLNSWLTKKTRADFYRHSAFFGKTRMITTWDDRSKNVVVDLVVDDLAKGYDTADDAPFFTLSENRFPRLDGESYEPAFLLTGEKPKPGENERAALARMITSHPQFARATVNLIWGKLMTAAFVEPYNAFDLDRIDPDNPPEAPWTIQPTNPERNCLPLWVDQGDGGVVGSTKD